MTTQTTTLNRIAIPTNFEKCAKNAYIYAASFFKPFGSNFTLINTFESDGSNYQEHEKKSKESAQMISKESELMKALVGKSSVKDLSVNGRPDYLSNSVFNSHQFDCIAMGTSGSLNSGKTKTSELINQVETNFLVVPELARFSPLKKILLVTDLKDPQSDYGLEQMTLLTTAYEATVELGIVSDYGEELDHEQTQNLAHLKSTLKLTDDQIHHVHEENAVKGILKIGRTYKPDLVVAPGRHKSFIDRLTRHSVTQKLAEQLTIPLFVTAKH